MNGGRHTRQALDGGTRRWRKSLGLGPAGSRLGIEIRSQEPDKVADADIVLQLERCVIGNSFDHTAKSVALETFVGDDVNVLDLLTALLARSERVVRGWLPRGKLVWRHLAVSVAVCHCQCQSM